MLNDVKNMLFHYNFTMKFQDFKGIPIWWVEMLHSFLHLFHARPCESGVY